MDEVHGHVADPAIHVPIPAHIADGWYGCEHPERPPDGLTSWEGHCRPCRLHLAAALHNAADPLESINQVRAASFARIKSMSMAEAAATLAERFDDPILAREAHAALARVRR